MRDSIQIIQDFPPSESTASDSEIGGSRTKKRKTRHGMTVMDADYRAQKQYIETGKGTIDFERKGVCAICHDELEHGTSLYTICPNPGCETVTHLTCLGKHFLNDEEDALVPVEGDCPTCKTELRWIDIVRELSLRVRGQKEVQKLLKGKRVGKLRGVTGSQVVLESSHSEDEADDEIMERELDSEIRRLKEVNSETNRSETCDSWHIIDDTDESDTGSIVSNYSHTKKVAPYQASKAGGLGTAVEDSGWHDAEILD